MNRGDYILATKWSDGDPGDHWAVGFFDHMLGERFIVVDSEGQPFRANGFRKVKKISTDRGAWVLAHAKEIELSGRSVWGWLRRPMNPKPSMSRSEPMNDGVAYLLRLKSLLDRDNMPLPRGIILTEKMYEDIEHAYPVAMLAGKYMGTKEEGEFGVFMGIRVYKEKE